ncbi:unannotated protein [freshwater metagenome]|uniref:Unannotated protein n=1 Tax=freshwater metagenome TaxID=449393 RepID=A0A6J6C7J1_9ZZZZ
MEDEVERKFLAILGANHLLDFAKKFWTKLDVTWLVDTVNVSEG